MESGFGISKNPNKQDEDTIFNKSLVPRLFGGRVVIIQSGSFKGRESCKGEKSDTKVASFMKSLLYKYGVVLSY